MFPKIFVSLIVRVTQVFSNSRVFVFLNALKKVSASIANIIRITQMTFEFVNNAQQVDSSSREINSRFATFREMHPFGLFCHSRIKDQPTLYVDSCLILERK